MPYGLSRVELRGERGTYVATLYRENGLRVAVEDPKSDVMIALHAPRDLTDGRLMAHPFSCTHDDLILTGQGPYGHRFWCSPPGRTTLPIVDDYAQGEFRQGVLYTLESLGICPAISISESIAWKTASSRNPVPMGISPVSDGS